MAKSKVFVASSGRALEIAKQLCAQLDKNQCEPELWKDVGERKAGTSILGMLKEVNKEYDFAVVVFARDDLLLKVTNEADAQAVGNGVAMSVHDRSAKAKARDNCVFEAGLFMGVMGEKRCFLVSSLEDGDLPTDLGGIIYIRFTEPEDPAKLRDENACKELIQAASKVVDRRIFEMGRRTDRPLSRQKLLDREKRNFEGGDLFADQVVVTSMQPLEVDVDAAKRVRRNIDKGNIKYVYFFRGDRDGAIKTCQLLQMVMLANILETQAEANDWQGLLAKVDSNRNEIIRDLSRMANQERLKVYFLPTPPEFEYCIHNAASNNSAAKMYLKRGQEEFSEWLSGEEAYRFWEKVRNARAALNPVPRKAVFHSVPGSVINEEDLRDAMGEYFPAPGMCDEMMDLCLKGPTDNKEKQEQRTTQPLSPNA